ncbi:hypothetical protein CEXT_491751 [Caerostris extrusa]|uniref:Uncharacterized protein n=1 Tax=Caerostris extrusa TaxID=172846 RepID=A0AAV4S6C0_CAEEX|nr:hypothetical protein CEXT_491751 [Caerostris extrusa]
MKKRCHYFNQRGVTVLGNSQELHLCNSQPFFPNYSSPTEGLWVYEIIMPIVWYCLWVPSQLPQFGNPMLLVRWKLYNRNSKIKTQ